MLHDEWLLDPRRVEALAKLESWDLYDRQELYVLLFDRSRTLSLNLFKHIHGESRDRGGAMVDLLEMYRAGGFDLIGTELPDHLPVLLEYLSARPLAAIAEADPRAAKVETLLSAEDDDPKDPAALDAVWSEAQVTFGLVPNAGCPASRDPLARMDPAPKPRAAS